MRKTLRVWKEQLKTNCSLGLAWEFQILSTEKTGVVGSPRFQGKEMETQVAGLIPYERRAHRRLVREFKGYWPLCGSQLHSLTQDWVS